MFFLVWHGEPSPEVRARGRAPAPRRSRRRSRARLARRASSRSSRRSAACSAIPGVWEPVRGLAATHGREPLVAADRGRGLADEPRSRRRARRGRALRRLAASTAHRRELVTAAARARSGRSSTSSASTSSTTRSSTGPAVAVADLACGRRRGAARRGLARSRSAARAQEAGSRRGARRRPGLLRTYALAITATVVVLAIVFVVGALMLTTLLIVLPLAAALVVWLAAAAARADRRARAARRAGRGRRSGSARSLDFDFGPTALAARRREQRVVRRPRRLLPRRLLRLLALARRARPSSSARPRSATGSGRAASGPRAYFGLMLFLTGSIVGVFASQDLLLFYVFFEAMLIPLYVLIGVWGGPERIAATRHVRHLHDGRIAADARLGRRASASRRARSASQTGGTSDNDWIFLGFLAAFAVKAPLLPLPRLAARRVHASRRRRSRPCSRASSPRPPCSASSTIVLPHFPEPVEDFRGLILVLAAAGARLRLAARLPPARRARRRSRTRRWRRWA